MDDQTIATTNETTTVETPVVQTPAPAASDVPAPVIPEGYVPQTELDAIRTRAESAEAARAALETERNAIVAERESERAAARTQSITDIATRLNFNDPADANLVLKGDEADIEAALKAVIEAKPYLAKTELVITPTRPTNPARETSALPVFTSAQIGDRAFYVANKAAIMKALSEGRVSG